MELEVVAACHCFVPEPPKDISESVEVKSAFHNPGYMSARIDRCAVCGTQWLIGYVESFVGVPIEEEWGKREWINKPLNPDEIERILQANEPGQPSLDMHEFA